MGFPNEPHERRGCWKPAVSRDPQSTEVNIRGQPPKVCEEAIHDLTLTLNSVWTLHVTKPITGIFPLLI